MERQEPKQEAPKQYTKEQFIEMFNKLCNTTGFTIGAHPEFRFRDDQTFSVIVVMTVENLPEVKNKRALS
jgi:hypothetical protein